MPIQVTTDLPDEDQPLLGNGVEDEIAVDRETQTTNYGSVRVHYRETGASSWIDWGVVAYSRLDPVISGLEDGEQYEIRLRSETEHVIGNWTSPVSIVTAFPGASAVQVDTQSTTSVTLAWTDNSDNEDGFIVERRERFRDGWGDWRDRADRAPNTTSHTDDVLPNTTYEFRVRAYTEHSAAASGAVETTTPDDSVSTDRVPAEGWHVLIEDPDGNVFTPDVVGEPSMRPRLNALPTVEVPVERAGRWEDHTTWEHQPMRVYLDGERKPIERLEKPRQEDDRTVLVGKGGVELENLVEQDVVERDAHLVAQDIIQTTPYAAHVDDPSSDTSADVLQESVDAESEWDAAVGGPPADALWETDGNGRLRSRQTAYFTEAEDADTVLIGTELRESSSGRWSGNSVIEIDQAVQNNTWAEVSETLTTDHAIPSADLGAAFRLQFPGDGHFAFELRVDGTVIDTISADALPGGETAPDWFDAAAGGDLADPVPAGDHKLTLKVTADSSASDPRIFVDCLTLYDNRSAPGFSEQVINGVLEGPDLRPNAVDVATGDITTVRQVVGGRLDISVNTTANGQAIALSNDSGGTWPISGSNTESIEGSFSSGSSSLRARFTLSGYDSDPSTSPAGRKGPTEVDLYSLFADLDDTPLLASRGLSGSGVDLLNQVAELDFIWEVVWDVDLGGIAVEWTQPGQRSATVDPSLVDYSVETDYGSVVRKAIIKGTLVPIEGEEVTVSHDAVIGLAEDYTAETGERVMSQDGSTQYERGVDYEWWPNEGAIEALSTGSISDGETVVIDYRHHIVGTYESADYDGTYPVYETTLPNVTTQRSADQAALIAVTRASEPIQTASVTIDADPSGVDLVEALDIDQLPTDNPLEPWSIDDSPGSVELQLGSRDPIDETLNRLDSRLAAVSKKV